jgi:exopolysaccharide biosynthesis predicted pyruvyltransferase EpsI
MLRPSDELVARTEEFSRVTGETVVYMGDYFYNSKNIHFSGTDGVEDFLSALIYADYVITNSFHATILSVLFEKNFCSMVIDRTGSRVSDFLKEVNLEDRIIKNGSLVSLLKQEPDFSSARDVIAKKRLDSLSYIQNIIESK